MSNIINLEDYRDCELIASFNVLRKPNGEIAINVTYMQPREIEKFDTIYERLYYLADLIKSGLASFLKEANIFKKDSY